MKLWLLSGKVASYYCGCDAFVVRAESPESARELAIQFIKKEVAGDNTKDFLTCPIVEITAAGSAEVILPVFKER